MIANRPRNLEIIRRRDDGQSYGRIAKALCLSPNIPASVCRNAGMSKPRIIVEAA